MIGVADDVTRAYCRTRSAKHTVATATIWEDLVPLLQKLAAQYNARPVMLPCTNKFVWWLNARREEIGEVAECLGLEIKFPENEAIDDFTGSKITTDGSGSSLEANCLSPIALAKAGACTH